MVDGWDLIQRPLVWHPGASTMSAAPGSPLFLPPPPSRYTLHTMVEHISKGPPILGTHAHPPCLQCSAPHPDASASF